jgi:hypothetical protein
MLEPPMRQQLADPRLVLGVAAQHCPPVEIHATWSCGSETSQETSAVEPPHALR